VTACKRNRLERAERDLFRIIQRKPDDAANLLIVNTIHDGGYGHDVDPVRVQVLDRPQLYVEKVADQPMRVGGGTDAIELQIGVAQSRLGGFFAEFGTLGELDPIGGGLYALIPDLPRVADRVEEVG